MRQLGLGGPTYLLDLVAQPPAEGGRWESAPLRDATGRAEEAKVMVWSDTTARAAVLVLASALAICLAGTAEAASPSQPEPPPPPVNSTQCIHSGGRVASAPDNDRLRVCVGGPFNGQPVIPSPSDR